MSLEVGRVEARLGFRVDDSGADRYEKRLHGLRQDAKKDVTTDAKLDVDQRGFDQYGKRVREVDRHHGDLVRSGGRVRTGFGAIWGAGGAAFAAAGGAYALVKGVQAVVGAYGESQKVGAQTNAVLKSTGGAAGVSAKEVGDLSTALSKKSGMDDEAIQSGENLLLTFTNVRNEAGKGNDIFTQATSIMTDMSQALGQDTKSSAIQLGKALNDPIKGVTALQRVGVSFTQSQKDHIKTLVESGHKMEAQKLILGELRKEFGGSAEAYGKTLPGAMSRAKVAFENLEETIGKKLGPVLTKAANWLADLFSGGGKASSSMNKVRSVIAGVGDVGRRVFGFLKTVVEDNRASFEKIGRAFSSVGQSVGRVFNGIYNAAKKVFSGSSGIGDDVRSIIKVFLAVRAAVDSVAAAIIKRAVPGIVTTFKGLFMVIKGVVQVIAGILTLDFGKVWAGVKNIVGGAVRVIGGLIRTLTAPFREVFAMIGSVVGKGIGAAVHFIASLPGRAAGYFRQTVAAALHFGRDLVTAAANAGRRFLSRIIDFVSDLPGRVWTWLKRTIVRIGDFERAVIEKAASAGKKLVGRFINFAEDLPGKLWDAIKGGLVKIGDFERSAASKAADAGQSIVNGIIDKVKQVPGKVFDFLKSVPGRIGAALKGTGKAIVSTLGSAADMGKAIANAVIGLLNSAIPNKISIPHAPDIDLPDNPIPRFARGGKAGPGQGGPAIIFGEGKADEWWVSQEGDRRKNVGWAIEALQTLTGRKVSLYRGGGHRGGGHHKKKPHFASVSHVVGTGPGKADDAIANIERDLGRLDRLYGQLERSQGLTDEQFVIEHDDGSATVDQDAVNQRAGEIDALIDFKKNRIRKKIEEYQKALKGAVGTYQDAIKRLSRALKRAKKRKASSNVLDGYRGKIADFQGRIGELQDAGRDLDLDLGDVDLDVQELEGEKAEVQGTKAPAAPAADTGGSSTSTDTGGGTVDTGGGTTTGPTPEDIARAAIAEVTAFNTAQSDLFSSFGSNLVRSGADPSGVLGGLRAFGAGGSTEGLFGAGGGGDVTVNIEQHYASPPPPSLWTDDVARRVQGALG